MSKFLTDLTILVPSIDGLCRLKFVCNWLEKNKFDGCYLIIDGTVNSKAAHFKKFQFVTYIHKPQCNTSEALNIGSKAIKSKFTAFLGDDDLPLLKKYKKLIDFLHANSNYDSVRGCSGFINFDELSKRKSLNRLAKINFLSRTLFSSQSNGNTNLDSVSGPERLNSISRKYIGSQYFITKSNIIKKLYNNEFGSLSDVYLSEYAFNFSHALFARTKYLPILYMIRGLHKRRQTQDLEKHKLDISGKVETELKLYIDTLDIESQVRPILYRMIINNRYICENSRLLNLNKKKSSFQSFLNRVNQILFSLCYQSREKWALVFFDKSSKYK
jgi:glycosyltransferase domain-containing protein